MIQKILIRKDGRPAILITFRSESDKFESNTERNRFFSELYGRKQIIIKKEKRYIYRRPGLLGQIPNIKVDDSVFIVAMKHLKMMEEFMNEWQRKVSFETFPVMVSKREANELEKETEGQT